MSDLKTSTKVAATAVVLAALTAASSCAFGSPGTRSGTTPTQGTSSLLIVPVGTTATTPAASLRPEREVTFTKDIAPILQQHCQICHQPGSIGPMPLITYEQVKPFAALIRQRVEARIMPPFHIDKSVGITAFKNDNSLSDEEIATIAAWAEAGAPQGTLIDMPPPVKWPDESVWQNESRLGAPDLILKSAPYTVPERGQDGWWRPTTPTGLTEPRWVRAVEVKPSYPLGRRVTHHTLVTLMQQEQGVTGLASTAAGVNSAGLLTEWAIGKVGEIYPENTGKLMLPGSQIRWEVHYWPNGQVVPDDQVTMALWFYPKGQEPKYRTILNFWNVAPGGELEIPPGQKTIHQNTVVLQAPARIESFQPHMHMRGKAMSMEAIYPNGRREMLNMVSNFQWKWHINYLYETDQAPLLPKGTVLLFTAWHDNTKENPNNPDADQFITWGDRTVDEMAHAWVGVTYLEQADFDRMTAERAARGRGAAAAPPEEHQHIVP